MAHRSFADILAEASKTLDEIEANKKGVPRGAATQLVKPSVTGQTQNGNGKVDAE